MQLITFNASDGKHKKSASRIFGDV